MKKQVISEAGDWNLWTKELKESLATFKDNTQVGEKIVFENDIVRVWSIHLPPGKSLPFHKHANPYFWTAMTAGKSRSHYNNGAIVDIEYDINDTKYFEDLSEENFFIHNLENRGNSTLIFTTTEFLK